MLNERRDSMGLFEFFKRKKTEEQHEKVNVPRSGVAYSEKIDIDNPAFSSIQNRFIAFDVETTGLSPYTDRIIEIGAVLFRDGTPVDSYSTLVNPKVRIPDAASAVNHITNAMIATAPSEEEAYAGLFRFLGDAFDGKTIMCAHNAKFDFDFLCNALSRLGYDAKIRYVDTLSLSRRYIKGLVNYKQCTIESHFGFSNPKSHRAASDAEMCGRILCRLLSHAEREKEQEKQEIEKVSPSEEELEVCAYIQNIIKQAGNDIGWIRYKRNNSNYVDVLCLYTFLKFKFSKKGKYIIVKREAIKDHTFAVEPCTASEGGTTYARVYFSNPFDLEPLTEYIINAYVNCYTSMQSYIAMGSYAKKNAQETIENFRALSECEVEQYLNAAQVRRNRTEEKSIKVCIEDTKPAVSRDQVDVNPVHNRVPISDVRNLNNWEKGFDEGFPYWEKGERERKNGDLQTSINLFDLARFYGYNAPALYTSYAKAYRQLKDYANEIAILEEGIARKVTRDTGVLEARRDKAIKLLFIQQTADKKRLEDRSPAAPSERENTPVEQKKPALVKGRAIIQMDDDQIIIKEFDTIAAAVRETGISSKSIRDAANGVQKHAGGYCWKYRD